MPENDILIVDDEAGIRDLFREALQDNGYLADVAATASEARELLEKTSVPAGGRGLAPA